MWSYFPRFNQDTWPLTPGQGVVSSFKHSPFFFLALLPLADTQLVLTKCFAPSCFCGSALPEANCASTFCGRAMHTSLGQHSEQNQEENVSDSWTPVAERGHTCRTERQQRIASLKSTTRSVCCVCVLRPEEGFQEGFPPGVTSHPSIWVFSNKQHPKVPAWPHTE